MARFVDLEDSDEEAALDTSQAYLQRVIAAARLPQQIEQRPPPDTDASEQASGYSFAAVLACYPVALSLAKHLDLVDLNELSRTCRSIHRNLTQYSTQLKANSLRCTFDDQPLLSDLRLSQSTSSSEHTRSAEYGIHLSQHGQFTGSYKIRGCARDTVAPCRKCGIIVCRNCIVKPPSNKYLEERHRRLCRTCIDAPLSDHLHPIKDEVLQHDNPPASSASSTKSARSLSGSSHCEEEDHALHVDPEGSQDPAFTSQAFLRDPCICSRPYAHFCGACGHNLRANDSTYRRVWTWRSRYSTHIGGGLGVGLGVGDQGQKCGRGDHCLDSSIGSVSWVEIDCSDGNLAEHGSDADSLAGSRVGTPLGHRPSSSPANNKPGYLQQEIEGIGGVVKKKVKKRVRTGGTVWEYEDERKSGKYLSRETSGKERSWCGWCDRICLGEADRQQYTST